jgi:hypothetical protein
VIASHVVLLAENDPDRNPTNNYTFRLLGRSAEETSQYRAILRKTMVQPAILRSIAG